MAITIILLYLLIIIVSLTVYFIKKRMNYWQEQGIAHNTPSLISGNFNGVQTQCSIADCIRQTYEQFKGTGPFCGFYFLLRPAVVILDTALVKNILIKDFSNFKNRGVFCNEQNDPLTGHLFRLDSEKWKTLRNKLSPTFTSGKMKFMYPTVIQVAEKFVAKFDQLSQGNAEVEVKELLARFTTDVIGTCAFGIDCNSLEDPNSEFRLMGKRAMGARRHGKLLMGFIDSFPELAKKLHMKQIPEDVTQFFLRIVSETVAYRETHRIEKHDFLSILIDLKNVKAGEKAVKLNATEMSAQVFSFFLGGFETSSSTTAFALYKLALNQEIQQKMRLEINAVFDEEGHINYEALHKLQYVGQVISETFRKYTIVPHLNRQAMEDYVVPGHPGYVIKKGMPVIIPSYGIHHDPDLYPQPEKFDPDRFDVNRVKQRDSTEFLAFGDGPRNCIGMRFGLMQTRVSLAYLLRNFKFSTCSKTEVPLVWDIKSRILSTKNGIFLKVEKL